MGRKRPRGYCRICGEYKKLSFEHVPPGATYNKNAAKMVSLKECIELEHKGVMPWELDKAKGSICQRGKGDYYLCEDCNNKTGAWYGKHYKRFVDALMCAYQECKGKAYESVTLEMKSMRPLPIIKQIITMFCDINEQFTKNNTNLRNYLLEKDNNSLDSKYRVFMYLMKGGMERTSPISAIINLGRKKPILISEISSIPVGLLLYVDLPDDYLPSGTEITHFTDYLYEDTRDISIPLNIFENNSWLPADFRTKEEVAVTIKDNQKWAEDNLEEYQIKKNDGGLVAPIRK